MLAGIYLHKQGPQLSTCFNIALHIKNSGVFFEGFLLLFLNVLERLVLASLPRNITLHIVVVVKPEGRWARQLWRLLLLLLFLLWWQPKVQPIPYLVHCNFFDFEDVKSQVLGIPIKELWGFQKRRWEGIQSPIFQISFFHPPIISGGKKIK